MMTSADIRDRALGCMIGSAVGDALGAPVEFMRPGTFPAITGYRAGGPFNLRAGEWTDDTAMAFALADALLTDPELHSKRACSNWLLWYREGAFIPAGNCFDIGNQTRNSLEAFAAGRGLDRTRAAGNGGIMRLAPVATRWWFDADCCAQIAVRQSQQTHNSVECDYGAASLALDLADLIQLGAGASRNWAQIAQPEKNDGYVFRTLHNAIWAYMAETDFRGTVLRAVNLGGDSDTVGAVAGAVAGAAYGLSSIPVEWITGLIWHNHLITAAESLWEHSSVQAATRASGSLRGHIEGSVRSVGEGDATFLDEFGAEDYKRLSPETSRRWRTQGLNSKAMRDPRYGGNERCPIVLSEAGQ